MKDREMKLVNRLLGSKKIPFEEIREELNVSRRTLYYDVQNINESLKGLGTIMIDRQEVFINGDNKKIADFIKSPDDINYEIYLKYENRRRYILLQIFSGVKVRRSDLADNMYVSLITVKDTIKRMKEELSLKGISLIYSDGYKVKGNEIEIRDLFMDIHSDFSESINKTEAVELFNKVSGLKLTDYSIDNLSKMVRFIETRVTGNNAISDYSRYVDSQSFEHYKHIDLLLPEGSSEAEKMYMSAYVSSLSSLNSFVSENEINIVVELLLDTIERNLSVYLKDRDECKRNISRHIASSYNRIKYDFPINNPLLEIIKFKYQSLFLMTKSLFKDKGNLIHLQGIRDEEIAFIISYIGAYTYKDEHSESNRKKVVIVCPNGITVSKTIEYQIERYFPQIEILDSIGISNLEEYNKQYDNIITTIPIKGYEDAIVVNPILRNYDLDAISKSIFNDFQRFKEIDIEDLLAGIGKYADIRDEKSLRKVLYNIIYNTQSKQEGGSPMLKETLLPNRIRFAKSIASWEEAIRVAALPLLEEGTITEEYIKAMIDSLHVNGPYIVLDDYFALAHARPNQGVNKLSMSMLKIDDSVDFLGKEVKIIVVLAATDNKKHLKALASLTEMFMEKENVQTIIETQKIQDVIDMINKYS